MCRLWRVCISVCALVCVCVLSVSLCMRFCFCFVKKHSLVSNGWHRSAFRQTGSREGSRSLVVTGAIALHPAAPPVPISIPLFLCGWAEGCRLMKRVWTTKKSGSHLADTPAHLWPSESSHHDRPHTPPSPPPPVLYLSPRRPTFPWVRPRRLAARSLPNTAHPRWHQTAMRKRERVVGRTVFQIRGFCLWWKYPIYAKGKCCCFQVGSKKTTKLVCRADADFCSCPADQEPVLNSWAAPFPTDHTVTRLKICWWI